MALYRKTMQTPDVPTTMGVLWGDEVAGIRRIMDMDETVGAIQSRLNKHPSKDLYERNRLVGGDWILRTYANMTEKQYLELSGGTATLVSNVLTMNDGELIEE